MADEQIKLFDFSGGVVNARQNPLDFPDSAVVDGENCDLSQKTIKTRLGYAEVLDLTSGVVKHLEQVRFPTNRSSYLLAQVEASGTSKLYGSVTQLPDGSDAFVELATLGDVGRISIAQLNDRAVIAAEGMEPLVFPGCMSTDGSDWAVPKQCLALQSGTSFYDIGTEVCDADADTTASLASFPTTGFVYVCLDVKRASGLYFDVGTVNTNAAAMKVERYTSGSWSTLTITDGTSTGGVSLAKSGVVTWTAADTEYQVVAELPGFWLRVSWTAQLSGSVALARLLYDAPVQDLQNIGADTPMNCLAFLYYDASSTSYKDWSVEVSDKSILTYARLNDGNVNSPTPMGTSDAIYIAGLTRFSAVMITPENNHNNQTASVLSGYYWNGTSWTALSGFSDGTASGGITLAVPGKVSWTVPTAWRQYKVNGTFPMGYWVKLVVTASVSARTYLTEAQIYPVQDPLKKHSLCMTVRDRIVLLNRPDAPDQLEISRALEEYGWTGEDAYSLRVGGQDQIVGCCSIFNQGWVAKTEDWFMLNGYSPATFASERAETSNQTPVNHHCIVRAPIPEQTANKQGLYFLNHTGAWCFTGLQIYQISSTVNWWDEETEGIRIDLDNLHVCSGVYWAKKNWVVWTVPMRTTTAQTTNNRLIVYDVNLKTWLPPFTVSAASLATARHYEADAPGLLGQLGLYMGGYDGRVCRLFGPTAEDDAGDAISWWVETGWQSYGVPHVVKLLRKLVMFGDSDSTVYLDFYRNGSETAESTAQLAVSSLSGLTGADFSEEIRGQNVAGSFMKLRISGTGPATIYGLMLGIESVRDNLV